jgi:GNAT superfamily N-acetyltransferase
MEDGFVQTQTSFCGHTRPARWPADLPVATALLRAYADFLVHNPAGPVNICLEGYERELASLPELFSEGNGALLLAFIEDRPSVIAEDRPAGCVAVKIRHDRPGACEMKRLWVDPAYRGKRLGENLTKAAIDWSRDHGYETLLLDTVPAAMPQAAALYRSLGFREATRHNDNPVHGLAFFELDLI